MLLLSVQKHVQVLDVLHLRFNLENLVEGWNNLDGNDHPALFL